MQLDFFTVPKKPPIRILNFLLCLKFCAKVLPFFEITNNRIRIFDGAQKIFVQSKKLVNRGWRRLRSVARGRLFKQALHKHQREEAQQQGIGGLFLIAVGVSFGYHLVAHHIEHGTTGKSQQGRQQSVG